MCRGCFRRESARRLPTEAAEPLGPRIPRVSSTEPSLSPSALAAVTVAGEAAF